MTDQVIAMAWSDIHPGIRVRWATPRFMKYGVVLRRDGRSMSIDFTDEDRPRVIPDARWYYVQPETGEEHLRVIAEIPDDLTIFFKKPNLTPDWITVQEACEMVKMDSKQLRRYVRKGTVIARKREDRWMIERDQFISTAMARGWL